MKGILSFFVLVALLVFGMGLVTHPSGTAQVVNASSNGLFKLLSLELGQVPSHKGR